MSGLFKYKKTIIIILLVAIFVLMLVAFTYKSPITYSLEDVSSIEIYCTAAGDGKSLISLEKGDWEQVYKSIKYTPFVRVDRFIDDDCGPDCKWVLIICHNGNVKDIYNRWSEDNVIKDICDENGYVKERIYIYDKRLIKTIELLIDKYNSKTRNSN